MRLTRSLHRLSAWIACWAILLAALAPSISHALAAAQGGKIAWMEICSTSGVKPVVLAEAPDNPSSVPVEKILHVEHCPFCLKHADAAAFPAVTVLAMRTLVMPAAFPALFYQSPRPLFLWTAAQSRAPPVTF